MLWSCATNFVAIGGVSVSPPIEFDQATSRQEVKIQCPVIECFFNACATKETFSQCIPEDKDNKVSLQLMICLPPLLIKAEMKSRSKTTDDLGVTLMQ
jgi:hypothetical protein